MGALGIVTKVAAGTAIAAGVAGGVAFNVKIDGDAWNRGWKSGENAFVDTAGMFASVPALAAGAALAGVGVMCLRDGTSLLPKAVGGIVGLTFAGPLLAYGLGKLTGTNPWSAHERT